MSGVETRMRIGRKPTSLGQPVVGKPAKFRGCDTTFLTASIQGVPPKLAHTMPEETDRLIPGYRVIEKVSTNNAPEPPAHLIHRLMHPRLQRKANPG